MTISQSTPLRLLVIGVSWPPETFLNRLFKRIATRGIHVTLVTSDKPRQNTDLAPNVDIWYLPGWDHKPVQRPVRLGRRLVGGTLRSMVDTRHFFSAARSAGAGVESLAQLYCWLPFAGRHWDVCYIPWNSTAIDYLPLIDLWPSVISCRGSQINVAPLNPLRTSLREGLSISFDKASAVHCVSEAIRDEAMRYGLDKAKSAVIHPAVDPDMFRPLPVGSRPDEDILRVISTGSVNWRKGYEYALSAIRRLVDRGVPVQYDLIGDGPEQQRLLYTIQDLELGDHVVRHGKLPPDKVLARLQEADVFLLSSLSEGISNAVLEGMACGLPVVTTDVGGMSEAVTDGVEGFLTPPLDSVSLADALEELWRAPELRQRMGAAGRARVLRDFSLDDQADAFVELFRSVA